MQLRSLYLHQFRVFKEAFFELSPQFNVIHGPNAQGKTSLLEAIFFLVAGKSFRGAHTPELITQGASNFYLEAHLTKHGITQILRTTCSPQERKFVYNNTLVPSISHLLGLLQCVVASPDDVYLIKGGPFLRRQYLDVQIAQIDPLYVHHLTRYLRALKQRNCLLRANQMLTIESWEYEMASSAAYITKQRAIAVHDLDKSIGKIHQKLTDSKEILSLHYKSSAVEISEKEDYFLSLYKKNRRREVDLGITLHGPHKDDLFISIDGRDIRAFASEGQQRTCINSLRFAEWERLSQQSTEDPIMLIDDFGIGLDDHRRDLLLNHLKILAQVFITTTSSSIATGQAYSIHLIKVS